MKARIFISHNTQIFSVLFWVASYKNNFALCRTIANDDNSLMAHPFCDALLFDSSRRPKEK